MDDKHREDQPTVILVEDDRSVRRVLQYCLDDAGFEVIAVGTGAEALELIEHVLPQAVVLDLGLPDKLGKAVLERLILLQSNGNRHPVWVAISALDQDVAEVDYGPLGSSFLRKPFHPGDLVKTLEELLSEEIGN
jgi:two-component system KDP operon response regulator KdpE